MKNFILFFSFFVLIPFESTAKCCKTKMKKAEISTISDNFKTTETLKMPEPVIRINVEENTKNSTEQRTIKPNVIIVLSDDLDAIYTPQFFPEVLPVLDSLQKLGIDFKNSFTPMSICCPSRSATLTGTYAHTNGVYRNASVNGGWKYFKHNEPYTLPAYLSKTGYRTTMIGKYINGYGDDKNPQPIYGWTDGFVFTNFFFYKGYGYNTLGWDNGMPLNDTIWKADNVEKKHFGYTPDDYSTDVLTKEAVSFIKKAESNDDQPFFMYLTPSSPHFPLQAAPRYKEMADKRWSNTAVPLRVNYKNDYGKLATPAEKNKPLDKSSFLTSTWKKRVRQMDHGAFFYNLTFKGKVPSEIKSFLKADWYSRMSSLYALNDMIRTLISTLKENGEWNNTLLIVTSDNGYMMGAHAMLHKGNPYEEAIRVPMIITGGENLHLKTSGKTEEWVTNLDLMPTILDIAGVKIPESVEGISLVPLIYNDSITGFRDRFVMEYLGPGMTKDNLLEHSNLMMKIVPVYAMDHPTYNAIRMKVTTTENGVQKVNVYKYIEWQKNTGKKILNFSNLYRDKDPELMKKIATGDKKIVALKVKAEEVETELYNLTDDPYEMDNLLYYKPEEYKDMAMQLKLAMREIILKKK